MLHKLNNPIQQSVISLFLILIVAFFCFIFKAFIGYKVIAFILLVVVSFIAMFFKIIPTLLAAIVSALVWNFYFIQPYYTFHIGNTEDQFMFIMYFVIALINAVLTFKIRQFERLANEKESKLQSIKLYNTLLDCLSHELKTPIAAIIGSTDALQSNTHLNETNKSKLIAEIAIASFRLNNQVENLLNMSRLESGVIVAKKDWVDIHELIYEAIRMLEGVSYQQKIEVNRPEIISFYKLDHGLTVQLLYNLLHNAIVYTPKTSTISIKTASIPQGLWIEIIDEGNGFPEDEIELVFEKFYRLKNARAGGSGLGLSIVKGFVETQNGTIKLSNRNEGGAKFEILFNTEIATLKSIENE